jgi:hypothetical protein
LASGGVSTSGGFGLGGRTTPGAGTGRTSIGGGSGATCWLTTGALAPGGGFGGAAGGRGTLILAFGGTRRGSRPGTGTSEGG